MNSDGKSLNLEAERSASRFSRQQELGQFLRSRRERLSPEEAGLPGGARRRTPGLRREEVADIAGVGASWYTWLEQGREIRASGEALRRISRALSLNHDEIAYIFQLANVEIPHIETLCVSEISLTLHNVLDNLEFIPAYVHNQRWDRIAWNDAALALMGDFDRDPPEQRNTVWRTFTNANVRAYTQQWEHIAQVVVAEFHASSSKYFNEPWLRHFIAQLSAVSPDFRRSWAEREVISRREEKTIILHATAGALHLERSIFQIPYDARLSLVLFTPLEEDNSRRRLKELVKNFVATRQSR